MKIKEQKGKTHTKKAHTGAARVQAQRRRQQRTAQGGYSHSEDTAMRGRSEGASRMCQGRRHGPGKVQVQVQVWRRQGEVAAWGAQGARGHGRRVRGGKVMMRVLHTGQRKEKRKKKSEIK